jgi:hypothetical protein
LHARVRGLWTLFVDSTRIRRSERPIQTVRVGRQSLLSGLVDRDVIQVHQDPPWTTEDNRIRSGKPAMMKRERPKGGAAAINMLDRSVTGNSKPIDLELID